MKCYSSYIVGSSLESSALFDSVTKKKSIKRGFENSRPKLAVFYNKTYIRITPIIQPSLNFNVYAIKQQLQSNQVVAAVVSCNIIIILYL